MNAPKINDYIRGAIIAIALTALMRRRAIRRVMKGKPMTRRLRRLELRRRK